MMNISWRDKITNEEVLKLADERLYIVPTIKRRKMSYFGHMKTEEDMYVCIWVRAKASPLAMGEF